jgi:hypothetical protein
MFEEINVNPLMIEGSAAKMKRTARFSTSNIAEGATLISEISPRTSDVTNRMKERMVCRNKRATPSLDGSTDVKLSIHLGGCNTEDVTTWSLGLLQYIAERRPRSINVSNGVHDLVRPC